MKIILLHGGHLSKSYERLKTFIEVAKKRNWEIVQLSQDSPLSLSESLSSQSLFTKEKLFILQDLNKINKKELDWLRKKTGKLDGTLVIYYPDEIPVNLLKSLPTNIKIEEFKLPKLIFIFLEKIYPKNSKKAIKVFHQVIENEPVEFVFALIARQMRDLYWVKTDPKTLKLPEWRMAKLKRQSNSFTVKQLQQFISLLSDIDIEAKTSKSSLISSLDLLLATKLK
jgi:DNA polymerase III delta subunit